MKKIKYQFPDGVREIEVSDEFAVEYEKILAEEKRVERKETRRHNSMESMSNVGFEFEAKGCGVEEMLKKEALELYEDKILEVGELRLEREAEVMERWLSQYVTERQAEAFVDFYLFFMSKVEIAEEMNITEGAVRKLLKKAEESLAKHGLLECATSGNIDYSEEDWEYIVGDDEDEDIKNYTDNWMDTID